MAKTFTKFRSDLDEDILNLLEDDDETELKVQAKIPGVATSLPTDEDELEDDDYAEWETVDAIPQTYVRGEHSTVTHHDETVGQKGAEIPEAEMAEDLDEENEDEPVTPGGSYAKAEREAAAKRAKANRAKRAASREAKDGQEEYDAISEVLNQDDIHEPGSRASQDTHNLELAMKMRQRSPEYRKEQEAKKKKREAAAAVEKADPGGIKRKAAANVDKVAASLAKIKAERKAAKAAGKKVPSPYTAHAGTDRARPTTPRKSRAKTSNEDVEMSIDELSKKTLGKYVKRAARDIGNTEFNRGAGAATGMDQDDKYLKRTRRNRKVGIGRAVNRLVHGSSAGIKEETIEETPYTEEEWNALSESEKGDILLRQTFAKRIKRNRDLKKQKREVSRGKRKSGKTSDKVYDYMIDKEEGKDQKTEKNPPKGHRYAEDMSFKNFRSNLEEHQENPVYENIMDSLKKIVSRNQKSSLTFEDGSDVSVDPHSASDILKVYGALNKNNQPKMADLLSRNSAGFAKALDFALTQTSASDFASPGKITTLEP